MVNRPAMHVDTRHVRVELMLPGEHPGRERLVHLEDVDVAEGETCSLEDPRGRRDDPGEHHDGVVADDRHVPHRGPRTEAEPLRDRALHHESGGRAVGELQSVARGDDPVELRVASLQLVSPEDGAERGQRLDGRRRTDALVSDEQLALRSFPTVDGGGEQLTLEEPGASGRRGPRVGVGGEQIQVLAGESPTRRNHLGTDAQRDRSPALGVAGMGALTDGVLPHPRGEHLNAGHRFDTGGDHDIVRTRDDALRSEVERLLGGAALAVDRRLGPTPGTPPRAHRCVRRSTTAP